MGPEAGRGQAGHLREGYLLKIRKKSTRVKKKISEKEAFGNPFFVRNLI